ncbi:MAG: type II toxin-antitoxin system VapC family toxin [Candidatus Omnitrophica bacterium]|nr:type II toxin-antitoxin system VapC family toxin [Candidatus Omnitrophota bacterium]
MLLIDSSGWIEFFMDGPLAGTYAHHLKHPNDVLTPTVVLYEVYKVIKRQRNEEEALTAAAQMGKTQVVPIDDTIALTAADASLTYQLAMADAIVYATALTHKAKLVTSDADLASLPGVVYHKK